MPPLNIILKVFSSGSKYIIVQVMEMTEQNQSRLIVMEIYMLQVIVLGTLQLLIMTTLQSNTALRGFNNGLKHIMEMEQKTTKI